MKAKGDERELFNRNGRSSKCLSLQADVDLGQFIIIRLIAMAAATIVISGCTAQVAATDGYIYPDWSPPASP